MTFLAPLLLVLALPCAAWLVWWRLPGRALTLLRVCCYLLLVLALARPALRLPRRGGTVVVVADRSASLPPESLRQQAALIQTLQARRAAEDRIGVVSFASRAAVEHLPQQAAFGTFSAVHEPDASNLSEALSVALSLIPPEGAGRVLVLSDGRFTGSDPQAVAGAAAARGVAVDYRLQTRGAAGDTAVVRVDAPQELRAGEALLATAWIESPAEQTVAFTVRQGGAVVTEGSRRVPRGVSPILFRDVAGGPGVRGYEVSVSAGEGDPFSENNTARFLVRRAGGKPLLCVPASPESRLPHRLAGGGAEVVTRPAETLDGSLASLAGYAGIVIENTRADALGAETLRNVAAWVEHAGAGVLLTGGRNAFGLGGYYKSALEEVLPVTMELRREHRKFSMAIVVVLDRSGSMAVAVDGGKTKMDLANLGAMEVLNLLSDMDEMSVIAVDSAPHIVVNRAPVSRVRAQEGRILGIQSMGGGIFIYEALKAASLQLVGAETGVKHILLFADAADSEEPGRYKQLLAAAAGAGITVSVVGLGTRQDCDAALLEEIAQLGGGTCTFSDNAHEIPRLFAQDTFTVARNTLLTNAVTPTFTVALPQLSDALPYDAPALGGYNLCYLRPGSTAVAVSGDEHEAPLVALRNHGSGRALVFTGEADGALSGPFARWEHAGEFYGALARHCAGPLHDATSGFLAVQKSVPGGVSVTVYADTSRPEVRAVEGLGLTVLRHRPGDAPRAEHLHLPWRTADTLAAEVALTGRETLLATVTYPDGRTENLPPVCLPYSPEFAPEGRQDGGAVLAALADATGGGQVADVGGVWERMPRERRWVEVSAVAYLLAALAFLAEVFERRTGWFGGQRSAVGSRRSEVRGRRSEGGGQRAEARGQAPAPAAGQAGGAGRSGGRRAEQAEAARQPAESPLARAKRRAKERTG
jgi:hypothetical protein